MSRLLSLEARSCSTSHEPARPGMLSTTTGVFSEPEDFATAMRDDGCTNLVVLDSGSFSARLNRIALHRLRLLSAERSLRPHCILLRPERLDSDIRSIRSRCHAYLGRDRYVRRRDCHTQRRPQLLQPNRRTLPMGSNIAPDHASSGLRPCNNRRCIGDPARVVSLATFGEGMQASHPIAHEGHARRKNSGRRDYRARAGKYFGTGSDRSDRRMSVRRTRTTRQQCESQTY